MTGEVEQAKVDWDAMAPRSVFFGDIYFSGDGLNETRHVFLAGNDLERRFARAERFAVAELGFGSGLNMLAAWALWRKTAKRAGARLELLSFEKHPLSRADLARAHQAWPEFAAQSAALVGAYPPPVAGRTRIRLDEDVALTLVFGDAARALAETEGEIDAWFLDGFAPARNPEMWAPEIFAEMARLSGPGATAATFTVAGAVRRGLKAAGFEIEKRPGFGRKREMLTARLETPAKPACAAPWLHEENDVRARPGGEIAVIGGGVAGAALAHALGSHGFNPTIFDPDGLAGGASGNPAGLVMPRLDLGDQPIARFFIAAYLEALSTIDSLARDHGGAFFNPCGVLLKATDEAERARQRKIIVSTVIARSSHHNLVVSVNRNGDGRIHPRADAGGHFAAVAKARVKVAIGRLGRPHYGRPQQQRQQHW